MSTTFTVDGLPGVTFTAAYDPALSWLTIEGRNDAGELISGSGISVTPEVVEEVPVTPEPIVPDLNPGSAAEPEGGE
ncbi:hypothetical protein ACFYVR_16090 [Rhodococcus sp. NPDC003318]|uniref:hypothetical protein n=1 Tax=Rhodococcus sp. NPDC003318 TaxID=3364503 RepID=UPI0036D12C31